MRRDRKRDRDSARENYRAQRYQVRTAKRAWLNGE